MVTKIIINKQTSFQSVVFIGVEHTAKGWCVPFFDDILAIEHSKTINQ